MPEPIMSTPGPLACQAEDEPPIDAEPVVSNGSKKTPAGTTAPSFGAPFTPAEIGRVARSCLSELDAIAIVALSSAPASLPLAALVGLKVGLDYVNCVSEAEAGVILDRKAVACRADGGIPFLTADHDVHCSEMSPR